jgi:hypothetical protein
MFILVLQSSLALSGDGSDEQEKLHDRFRWTVVKTNSNDQ